MHPNVEFDVAQYKKGEAQGLNSFSAHLSIDSMQDAFELRYQNALAENLLR